MKKSTTWVVRPISVNEALVLRHKVLLPHLPSADDCVLAGDHRIDALHLGAFEEGQLIGVASFLSESLSQLPDPPHRRLRQMGVVAERRHCGVATALMGQGIQVLSGQEVSWIWCHAREAAYGFYKKVGMVFVGSTFDVPYIGAHRIMAISLEKTSQQNGLERTN
jgi:hypothetical protein